MSTSEGFSLRERTTGLTSMAPLSLRIALHSYFRTYATMRHSIHVFDPSTSIEASEVDGLHVSDYCEVFAGTVIHLHHFVELVCKEELGSVHPLLVLQAGNDHVPLHDMLTGRETDLDPDMARSIDFNVALTRLCALQKASRITGAIPDAIQGARGEIDHLARVRNGLIHRGVRLLRYPELDRLVVPLLAGLAPVFAAPAFASISRFWKHGPLSCGVDPLAELIRSDAGDLRRLAFFKELGRAAYESPIRHVGLVAIADELRSRSERAAKAAAEEDGVREVRVCPVCGAKALLVYDDAETDTGDPTTGYSEAYRYNWMVQCSSCSLEMDNHLANPREYGVDVDDFWEAEAL